ncbi:MAG: ThiF family adenylyltransferase [Victivallaceae bacterium]|nr:ThiF family adenylyltransferase [Victivallaceae bacterium]
MNKINVIGLGGIGGMLIGPLCRFLYFSSDTKCEIVLIDGDKFEEHNTSRQEVGIEGIGRNKAEVWKRRLLAEFKMPVLSVSEYVTPDNIGTLINDGDTVFLCVDNHATRKLVQERCERLRNVALVSGGNDYFDGNVQIFVKRNGRKLTAPITKYHPEIANPRDKRPDELGCDEEIESSPQLLFANMTAACLMLNAFYALKQGKLDYGEVYFDIRSNLTARQTRKAD